MLIEVLLSELVFFYLHFRLSASRETTISMMYCLRRSLDILSPTKRSFFFFPVIITSHSSFSSDVLNRMQIVSIFSPSIDVMPWLVRTQGGNNKLFAALRYSSIDRTMKQDDKLFHYRLD